MAKQGALASSSGNTLEKTVIGTLESKGFIAVTYRDWLRRPQLYGDELLLCNVPYTSIYGHNAKTEFVIRSKRYQLEIRIECKWQQSSGSVDEKFPYLYLNCIEAMPEQDIIIIVDGGGAKKEAVNWLRKTSELRQYIDPSHACKNIQVMNLSEFLIWANTTFR